MAKEKWYAVWPPAQAGTGTRPAAAARELVIRGWEGPEGAAATVHGVSGHKVRGGGSEAEARAHLAVWAAARAPPPEPTAQPEEIAFSPMARGPPTGSGAAVTAARRGNASGAPAAVSPIAEAGATESGSGWQFRPGNGAVLPGGPRPPPTPPPPRSHSPSGPRPAPPSLSA